MDLIKQKFNINKYGELNTIGLLSLDYFKEFKTDEDAQKWGELYYSYWAEQYKTSSKRIKTVLDNVINTDVIGHYCGYSYRQINNYLRYGFDDTKSKLYEKLSQNLISICSFAPLIPENIVVYRYPGDNVIEKIIKSNKKRIPFQERGFLSTSLVKNTITKQMEYKQNKYLLKIYVPKNTIGFYVNPIVARDEQEMLIYPNNFLQLIKYPYFDEESKKTIFECYLQNYDTLYNY